MNIIMAADKGMLSGLEMVIYSTMLHNVCVDWYIFTMNINCVVCGEWRSFSAVDSEDLRWLESIVKYHDSRSHIKVVDVSSLYAEYLENNPNRESGFTPFTTLRLLADLALPEVGDALYLDCDVIVQKNLGDMYYGYLPKCEDYCAYSIPYACDWEGEMVAGVLLLNLDKIRKNGFLSRARDNINRNQYRFPDQMALRDAGKPYPLPETYNYMFSLYKLCYEPHIIHFTNEIEGKIYSDGKTLFYKKFPQFRYIEEGLDTVRRISNII